MKKISIFLCIAAIFFLFTGVQESHSARKQQLTPSSVQPGTPDLKPTQDIGKPSIWFDLSTQPAPSPKLNQPFSLTIVSLNSAFWFSLVAFLIVQ